MSLRFFVFCSLLLPSVASAQRFPIEVPETVARATDRVAAVAACEGEALRGLREVTRLLAEAAAQHRAATTPESRRAAVDAAESLRQRAGRLLADVEACHPRRPPEIEAPQAVIQVVAPEDPAAASVGRAPSGPPIVEEDVLLASNVRVVAAQRVDGEGTLADEVPRAAIRGASSALSRCYDELVDRGALVRGQIILVFTIGADRAATRVATEGDTIHNTRFARCVQSAGSRIRATQAPAGGTATYSYTLAFPGT